MATRDYSTEEITVHWDSDICSHSGHCARTLRPVFDPKRRPWVDPTAAQADEIAAAVDGCPSGALSYTRHDGGPIGAGSRVPAATDAPPPVRITVSENGALEIEGEVELLDSDGRLIRAANRLSLCRCGLSQNKPYCDDAHWDGGFVDPGRPQR